METPYAGSSGWSGSEASRERADYQDNVGVTSERQQTVLHHLKRYRETGLTWPELTALTGLHHGQVTGPLSVLHKAGKVSRLTEKREKCSVYVLPEFVQDRETAAQGRKKTADSEWRTEAIDANAKLAAISSLVAPQWRSYSYGRNDLIDDIRKVLGE